MSSPVLSILVIFYLQILHIKIGHCKTYRGENFPVMFLKPDCVAPEQNDLNYFIKNLKKTVHYLTKRPNNTDSNISIGSYLMICVLQRTLLDYGDKLSSSQLKNVKSIISRADNYVSHYLYANKIFGYQSIEYKVSILYKDTDVFVHSMNNFNEQHLHKWILSDFEMHEFTKTLDEASLEKEMYIRIIDSMDKYHVSIHESDTCLSRIMDTPQPINMSRLRPCRRDVYCERCLLSQPSIGYSLSHRLLNIVFRIHARRCYLRSIEKDEETINVLCAFMYREAVYLARLGYFARDMFMEHVALCGILGYKEFYRLHWFKKVASWIDDQGCMYENRNFDINRTRIYKEDTLCMKKHKLHTKNLKKILLDDCQSHPMILSAVVLAHAVRYVTHMI